MTIAVTEIQELAALVTRLDLPEPDDRDHLILLLQARRADVRAVLAAGYGTVGPTASVVRCRTVNQEALVVIEAALLALDAPFETTADDGGES